MFVTLPSQLYDATGSVLLSRLFYPVYFNFHVNRRGEMVSVATAFCHRDAEDKFMRFFEFYSSPKFPVKTIPQIPANAITSELLNVHRVHRHWPGRLKNVYETP